MLSRFHLILERHGKNCYKFWWSEELSSLKAKAIKSNKIEININIDININRPRSRPIADPGNTNKHKTKDVVLRAAS